MDLFTLEQDADKSKFYRDNRSLSFILILLRDLKQLRK